MSDSGVLFPSDETGKRSSLAGGKAVWAAAAAVVDPALADAISAEPKWRTAYIKHAVKLADACAKKGAEATLKVAEVGIDAIYSSFEFVRDGKTTKMADAMGVASAARKLTTGKVMGSAPPTASLEVPYEGQTLSGDALVAQLKAWAEYGCMEPDAEAALSAIAADGKRLDLRGKVFIILGATSAMGPARHLLSWGATVIGVARAKPQNWAPLLETARASGGTFLFPCHTPVSASASDAEIAAAAGADLMVDTPEIAQWLIGLVQELGGPKPIVGMYTYLDSDAHVRVSLACDAIMSELVAAKAVGGLAYLGTPSLVYDIPREAYEASQDAYKAAWLPMLGYRPNARKPITPEAPGDAPARYVHDGLLPLQGPNYALAKTLQQWRAVLARSRDGLVVSSNLAPAARTASMVEGNKNSQIMVNALDGMGYFKPLAAFDSETVSAVMAALLVDDATNTQSSAHPSQPLGHPSAILTTNAFHGGSFRLGIHNADLGKWFVVAGKLLGRSAQPVSKI